MRKSIEPVWIEAFLEPVRIFRRIGRKNAASPSLARRNARLRLLVTFARRVNKIFSPIVDAPETNKPLNESGERNVPEAPPPF